MRKTPAHATDRQSQQRLDDVLRIRLDGAEFWDLCEFVREKETEEGSAWHLADGEAPLSDRQLYRYLARADKAIGESVEHHRERSVKRHLAQRRALYGKAVLSGDLRTALAVLRDEAQLRGLYPVVSPSLSAAVMAKLEELENRLADVGDG
jgi:hypothetical protein